MWILNHKTTVTEFVFTEGLDIYIVTVCWTQDLVFVAITDQLLLLKVKFREHNCKKVPLAVWRSLFHFKLCKCGVFKGERRWVMDAVEKPD